jgi:hypothetical protein
VDEQDGALTIAARGPAAQGQLPLSEMARLCGEFQATVERIALGLHGTTAAAGRRPKEVVEAARLIFTGFHAGSAVLELTRPPARDGGVLLEESLDVLAAGSAAIREGRTVPEAFSTPVLDGLIRLASGLGDDVITEVVVSRGGTPLVTIDQEMRRALRYARRQVRHDDTTIVGLLQMGDFAPSALRCRIDTIDASVTCTFDEGLSATVLACLNTLVVASGTGEFVAGGVLRSLDLSDLAPVERAGEPALDDLARAQGVTAWGDPSAVAGFGAGGELGDEEFAAFLAGALSSRGER